MQRLLKQVLFSLPRVRKEGCFKIQNYLVLKNIKVVKAQNEKNILWVILPTKHIKFIKIGDGI